MIIRLMLGISSCHRMLTPCWQLESMLIHCNPFVIAYNGRSLPPPSLFLVPFPFSLSLSLPSLSIGKRRYNIRLWKTFTDCFNCLPVAAILDEKIFCCHGGMYLRVMLCLLVHQCEWNCALVYKVSLPLFPTLNRFVTRSPVNGADKAYHEAYWCPWPRYMYSRNK